ncbi:hypothetical protein LTR36_000962 [Oleoguttula mirabilis]|uniref:Endopolyphosphatase n=1 Tax=Oleoguttula mirabilis TaxID=1507867 RepID=A0AAV9JP27_9PEZI|nr:hypothetical protein LTR36_000962 [Oleoguttula mirabilis]
MLGARCFSLALAALLFADAHAAPPAQLPLRYEQPVPQHVKQSVVTEKKRPLHGRFLHVTDFHPDRFYQAYSSTSQDAACHRGQGPAGIYGAETSECDSPIDLINATMRWIEQELKDNIDFVVWTGDSARHDNDDEIPRSAEQVVGLNKLMVQKMLEVFGKHNGDEEDEDPNNDYIIPIVPNLGNNDILPHNVMTKGPNAWTRTYANVWRQFIPEAQKHQFEQGGWYYVEVIPNRLAVFSLNTLYFFQSNAAVDGCASKHEPGFQQMEWLRIQLQFMRERGVKAILTGHVPPIRQEAKKTWDETCWQKYTLWLRQYRDVIVGSLYGHFNYDHFLLQDFRNLDEDTENGHMRPYQMEEDEDEDMNTAVSSDYFIQLRDEWSELPNPPRSLKGLGAMSENETEAKADSLLQLEVLPTKSKGDKKKQKHKQQQKLRKYIQQMGGPYAERFAASFVGPSVVPNFFPACRVFEYNITGLNQFTADSDVTLPPPHIDTPSDEEESATRQNKDKRVKFTVPEAPSKSAPPGPAYSPQTLSLLKYTQYYANITNINNDFRGTSRDGAEVEHGSDVLKWREGKHKGKRPHDKDHAPQPKEFKFQMHYDTRDDDVYKLPDLTMPSLVDLARRIGDFKSEKGNDLLPQTADERHDDEVDAEKKKKHKKKKHGKGKHGSKHRKQNEAWYTFVRRAFVETMDPEEIEEQFGH